MNKKLNSISSELNLRRSWTAYMKYGKGTKKKLRFSKSNDEIVEKMYSTHHVLILPGKQRPNNLFLCH